MVHIYCTLGRDFFYYHIDDSPLELSSLVDIVGVGLSTVAVSGYPWDPYSHGYGADTPVDNHIDAPLIDPVDFVELLIVFGYSYFSKRPFWVILTLVFDCFYYPTRVLESSVHSDRFLSIDLDY